MTTLFLALAVAVTVWDYGFSRDSRVLGELREREPEIYNALPCRSVLPPSVVIGQVIGRGHYLRIKSSDIKEQVFSLDRGRQAHVLWPWVLLMGWSLLHLILRATRN